MNIDYYSISINKLPKGLKNADEFYKFVKGNFAQFTKGSGTTFGEFNQGEKTIFNSSNPVSAIMRFEVSTLGFVPTDGLSVITSKVGHNYWVFSPVFTYYDWGHPVAGNRQFGLVENSNGSYVFFTRGADRPWGALDKAFSGMVFSGANKLWTTLMHNLADYVNNNGGKATINPAISKRVSWKKDILHK